MKGIYKFCLIIGLICGGLCVNTEKASAQMIVSDPLGLAQQSISYINDIMAQIANVIGMSGQVKHFMNTARYMSYAISLVGKLNALFGSYMRIKNFLLDYQFQLELTRGMTRYFNRIIQNNTKYRHSYTVMDNVEQYWSTLGDTIFLINQGYLRLIDKFTRDVCGIVNLFVTKISQKKPEEVWKELTSYLLNTKREMDRTAEMMHRLYIRKIEKSLQQSRIESANMFLSQFGF